MQGIGFLFLLQGQNVIGQLSSVALVANIALIVAGSLLLMWLGELVTEFGIGNGVSLIILAGILASVPSSISQTIFAASAANIPAYLAFTLLGGAMIYAVVVVSDAERSIPIAYARAMRGAALAQGAATYLPIRLLQAGVIPIIFALSLPLSPANGALDARCCQCFFRRQRESLVYRLPLQSVEVWLGLFRPRGALHLFLYCRYVRAEARC